MTQRRTFLRKAGMAGSMALLGSTAGCAGDGSGGEAGTASPTPTPTTTASEKPKVRLSFVPATPEAVGMKHAVESGILDKHFSDAGYEWELKFTWKGPPLYLSGKTDIAFDINPVETVQLGKKNDIHSAVVGKMEAAYLGMLVKAGGKWDPENTGSVKATIDGIANQGEKVGIAGWSGGDMPTHMIVMKSIFGKDFRKTKNDFQTVRSQYPSLPKLLTEGKVAMISNSPSHGAAAFLSSDPPKVKPLYWGHDILNRENLGFASLADVTARQEFVENNRPAVRAVLRARNEWMDWLFSDGVSEIPKNPEFRKMVGAPNEAVAEYVMKWFTGKDVPFAPKTEPYLTDSQLTEAYINEESKFLDNVAELGLLPDNWNEFLTFERVEL